MIRFESLPADILTRIPALGAFLAREDRVIFAYLFGGLARKGKADPLSDIDIAVFLRDLDGLAEYKLDLFHRISEMLGTAEIDLVVLNSAPTSLSGRILQTKILLADKEPHRRHIFESLTLRKFFDFRVKEATILNRRYGFGG